VDYRYHDPPLRPYVPWLEGYTVQGRDAQQLWHRQQLKQGLPPPGLTIAAPAVTARVSKCGFSGGYGDVRPKERVVKLRRLDVSIGFLAPLPWDFLRDRNSHRLH
jgi:hypothetical protein